MQRFRSERGDGAFGLVIFLVVLLFIAYEVKQFGPPCMRSFSFWTR